MSEWAGGLLLVAAFLILGWTRAPRVLEICRKRERYWTAEIQENLARDFLFVDISRIARCGKPILMTSILFSLATYSVWPAALALVAGIIAPFLIIVAVRRRRAARFHSQLEPALTQVASILKAGHSLERALESMARSAPSPMGQELLLATKELRLGHSLEEALLRLLKRFPSGELQMVCHAAAISRITGASLASVLEEAAGTLRKRSELFRKVRVLTAQGRLQGWLAMLLPPTSALAIAILDPEYMAPLTATPLGRKILFACLLALVIGMAWIHAICSRDPLK